MGDGRASEETSNEHADDERKEIVEDNRNGARERDITVKDDDV